MRKEKERPAPVCATSAALEVLGGKWKILILSCLAQYGTVRFLQLQRLIPGVTPKVLGQQLRELEDAGLVDRRVYAEVPPRVEYTLTGHGRTLSPVLAGLREWGHLHREVMGLSAVANCYVADDLLETHGGAA